MSHPAIAQVAENAAAQALAGDMASQSVDTGEFGNSTSAEHLTKRAEFFYRFADAMLAARKESK